MIGANYGPVIVAVLDQAWKVFGPFTPANQREVSRWVRDRVQEVRDGQAKPKAEPVATKFLSESTKRYALIEPTEDGWR